MDYCNVNGLECSECTPCCGSRKNFVVNEKHIELLEQSIKYFETQKKYLSSINLQGLMAINTAIMLINKELNNLKKE